VQEKGNAMMKWNAKTVLLAVACLPLMARAQDYSLRFYGHGTGDIDRVKIGIDAPATPADVAGDFTLEWWMKALPGENSSPACTPGADNWITGNTMFDRDIYGPGDFGDYGISLRGGRLAFGVADSSSAAGICGATNVANGVWHHVAVTRASSGAMRIYVDGVLDGSGSGPSGDISYNDGRSTSYPASDPYLVIGAEKHDAGPAYPSYRGWIDEVRLSDTIRYTSSFTPPAGPFVADGSTRALYHFDEGPTGACTGTIIDSSSFGSSPGQCSYGGGGTAGPVYSADTPFAPVWRDAVVVPVNPLNISLRPALAAPLVKRLRVKVVNANPLAAETQTIQLAATSDCPAGALVGQPDFDLTTPGVQSSVSLAGKRSKSATVSLSFDPAAFATFNRWAPNRCSVTLTATTLAPASSTDPVPSNNTAVVEINVVDRGDAEMTAVHESAVKTLAPVKVVLSLGAPPRVRKVRVPVTNADAGEPGGDVLSLTALPGDCPPGSVGPADFDPALPGTQGSAVVAGRRTKSATVELTIDPAAFAAGASKLSPARCTALLQVSGPGGDSVSSNDTARLVVDVVDRNDW
jgi:hypothetical protein